MKTIMIRLGQLVLLASLITGCASTTGPAKDSGLARFKLQWIVGTNRSNELRGNIVSLRDKDGKEIYNIKDRSTLTFTIDVPEGNYTMISTCAPASYRYEKDQHRFKYKLTEYYINTKSGDYVRLVPMRNERSYGCVAVPKVK